MIETALQNVFYQCKHVDIQIVSRIQADSSHRVQQVNDRCIRLPKTINQRTKRSGIVTTKATCAGIISRLMNDPYPGKNVRYIFSGGLYG
jgi:hypothetical protein